MRFFLHSIFPLLFSKFKGAFGTGGSDVLKETFKSEIRATSAAGAAGSDNIPWAGTFHDAAVTTGQSSVAVDSDS